MSKEKNYKVKEMYFTLQGEGFHTGKAAVFCRLAGCNLWSGLEKDRETAICKFCDTDFWGIDGENGGKYTAEALAEKVVALANGSTAPFVVITGGEPALQVDEVLINAFKAKNITIAIETNGTLPLPEGIDWICVSPKANTTLAITKGNELKLVFPQVENKPEDFEHLDFEQFYLQPLDDAHQASNIQACVAYCLQHPRWKLSLQTHKILGIN